LLDVAVADADCDDHRHASAVAEDAGLIAETEGGAIGLKLNSEPTATTTSVSAEVAPGASTAAAETLRTDCDPSHSGFYRHRKRIVPEIIDADKPRSDIALNLALATVDTDDVVNRTTYDQIADPAVLRSFSALLNKYQSQMASDRADTGCVPNVFMEIDLKPGSVPCHTPPYRSSYKFDDEIREQCTGLLQTGYIQRSTSPYASPVTIDFFRLGKYVPARPRRA
ncbi:MAG: hypothetical protein GY826_13305, partial [Fuerstiella sp.]|nr:hypothetical protein [Fuerstiella sp.]